MKKFLNANKKAIVCLAIFIILFPILIICLCQLGIIPRDIGLGLIGYGGAITGGFLTLYGVWWTIEDSNKNKKKELALQYCPILSADIIDHNWPKYHLGTEIIVLYRHKYFNDADLEYPDKVIKISNVGRGEILKTTLISQNCDIISTVPHELETELKLNKPKILFHEALDFIPRNGSFYLLIGLPKLREQYSEEIKSIRFSISLDIAIAGIFSSKEQDYKLKFFIDVHFNNHSVKYNFDSITLKKI